MELICGITSEKSDTSITDAFETFDTCRILSCGGRGAWGWVLYLSYLSPGSLCSWPLPCLFSSFGSWYRVVEAMDQNTLYEILECSVCMEVLDGTSRVLPCQHTFCRRCLDEIVATKKFLQCPECRMPVNKRVEDLPPNILLVRLLETMKTMAHQRSSNSRHNAECGRSSNRHATNRNANSTVSFCGGRFFVS